MIYLKISFIIEVKEAALKSDNKFKYKHQQCLQCLITKKPSKKITSLMKLKANSVSKQFKLYHNLTVDLHTSQIN